MYKRHDLVGGHVIKLGPGNDEAAKKALEAWPGKMLFSSTETLLSWVLQGGLQIGGGITDENALEWLEYGASKVSSRFSRRVPSVERIVGHRHFFSFSFWTIFNRTTPTIVETGRKG